MAKEPEKNSEYEAPIDAEYEELGEDDDEPGDVVFEKPTCPRCGWHNTRPSHTRKLIDKVLRTFSLRPFRCRSCGNRFHSVRRTAPN